MNSGSNYQFLKHIAASKWLRGHWQWFVLGKSSSSRNERNGFFDKYIHTLLTMVHRTQTEEAFFSEELKCFSKGRDLVRTHYRPSVLVELHKKKSRVNQRKTSGLWASLDSFLERKRREPCLNIWLWMSLPSREESSKRVKKYDVCVCFGDTFPSPQIHL